MSDNPTTEQRIRKELFRLKTMVKCSRLDRQRKYAVDSALFAAQVLLDDCKNQKYEFKGLELIKGGISQ